jgi:uncharacterized protein
MQPYINATRDWLTKAVIGLNLCPFAKAPWNKQQVRLSLTLADNAESLLAVLKSEIELLLSAPPDAANTTNASTAIETTLIIHPMVLTDFFDYNDFLNVADDLLVALDLEGIIQIASFHPQYQFAGTADSAPENNTNRSPFPMLHLLREQSIEQALESGQDAEAIVTRNIATMNHLGNAGWRTLLSND